METSISAFLNPKVSGYVNRKRYKYLFSFPTTIAVGHDQSMS